MVSRLVKTFNTVERCHHRKMWVALAVNAFDMAGNQPTGLNTNAIIFV